MRTLQVYYPNPDTGVLEMRFPSSKTPVEISGVQVLLQNIVLFLRTKPGSDVFDPERGSILGDQTSIVGAVTNINQLRVLITDAVDRCQTYIQDQQSKRIEQGITIPPDETLLQLEITNIYQGADDPTSIFVEILVYTEGNKQYFLTV